MASPGLHRGGEDLPGRRVAARRLLRAAALVLAGSFVAAGVVSLWVVWSASSRVYARSADVPARPVAIVLGNMVFSDGTPSLQFRDRLAMALELYRAGKVRRVLVSGARHGEYDEARVGAYWLERFGVPRAAIFIDRAGYRTVATMARAAQVFGVREAVVCTQRYHLPRALYFARRAGIDAVGVISDRSPYPEGGTRYTARELVARAGAVLEVAVTGVRGGQGERTPITGSSAAGWRALDEEARAAAKR